MLVLCVVFFCVYFLVLFEVLGSFKSLVANLSRLCKKREVWGENFDSYLADMRLQRGVD